MSLRQIQSDLWCLEGEIRLAPASYFPVRMTVARLAGGGLWVHSPIQLDDVSAAAIDALGPVRHIVAPSLLHHLFVAPARARWPGASFHAPASLVRKRPDLSVDIPLAEDSRWPELAIISIDGAPKVDEFVFVHRPSATLIVTDLLFNIHATRGITPWVLRMVGAWRRLAQSRVWRSSAVDRPAFRASGERLMAHEFARLVPAHGEIIEGGDTDARVRAALHWMLA